MPPFATDTKVPMALVTPPVVSAPVMPEHWPLQPLTGAPVEAVLPSSKVCAAHGKHTRSAEVVATAL
jgi:hypothetical protein